MAGRAPPVDMEVREPEPEDAADMPGIALPEDGVLIGEPGVDKRIVADELWSIHEGGPEDEG